MWTGAILAGGHARRLGGINKAGLILQPGGASVLDRQLARLRRVVDRTIIIANDAERFSGAGVPVIPDMVPDGGALAAIAAATNLLEQFTVPNQTLAEPPGSLPERTVARLAAEDR